MRITRHPFVFRVAATLSLTAVVAWALILHTPAYSSPPEQSGAPPITITKNDCDFDVDDDADGESDGRFDPADGQYLPQGDAVLADCFFNVTSTAAIKVTVESQLENWEAEGFYEKVARERDNPISLDGGNQSFTLDPGGHQIKFLMVGKIPRGHNRVDLGEGYYHDLQIPKRFKLIDITVTTDAGDKEWVASHEVSAASVSYIDARHEINQARNNAEGSVPASVLEFGEQLLGEGYPEIAVRAIELDFPQDAGETERKINVPSWVWLAIFGGIALISIVGVVIWWARKPPTLAGD